MTTPIRRSTRERKSATTIYDAAKEEIQNKTPPSSDRSKRKSNDNKNDDDDSHVTDDENSQNIMSDQDLSSEEDEESSDEESQASKRGKTITRKKKSPTKIHVTLNKYNNNKKKPNRTKASSGRTSAAGGIVGGGGTRTVKGTSVALQTALTKLRKKVMDSKTETPDKSLLAAIFMAVTPKPKSIYEDNDEEEANATVVQYPQTFQATRYTPLLEPICRKLLQQYQTNPNQVHVALLNLVFRSVGGTFETCLKRDDIIDEMDDDQWETTVTSIVDDMRHTSPDSILTCACPQGAVTMNDPTKHHAAQAEFRRILDHFWYLLGTLGLASTTSSEMATVFDVERIRDLCLRMMELCGAGQPDLRSSAAVAVLQLGLAACDATLELQTRLVTAQRQLAAAKATKTKTNAKQKALQTTVTALERSHEELEQLVMQTIIPGVFIKRYRDSNPYIRATCLDSLLQMMLKRPDWLLRDTYLKYFGWMMSDKDATVRKTALRALSGFFKVADQQGEDSKKSKTYHELQTIDLTKLQKVVHKFIPRMADCVIDVNQQVQEKAMSLLLALNQHGLTDDVEDDGIWNKINLRALAPDTTPNVRRDALYFVLEQLEDFDEENTKNLQERQKVNQIDAIATWLSHALSDGPVPMENLRVELTDFVVESLRSMPEHAHLMTDWNAILRAIHHDTEANLSQSKQQRITLAKQRVLLRMLASAAAMEIGSINSTSENDKHGMESDEILEIVDRDFIDVKRQLQLQTTSALSVKKKGGKKKSASANISREGLTVSLLKALPKLLQAYKGDLIVLRNLTALPQYFVASVLTLPNRKDAVQYLVNMLADIFLEATDTSVLQNVCLALCVLARGEHARNREALLKLQGVVVKVKKRLFELYNKKNEASQHDDDDMTDHGDDEQDSLNNELDRQHAISICLRRLRILSKRRNLGDLFAVDAVLEQTIGVREDSTIATIAEDPVVDLCAAVAKEVAKELRARQCNMPEGDDGSIMIPEIWQNTSSKMAQIHDIVAKSVVESLNLILSLTAWRLHDAINKDERAKAANKISDDEASKQSDENDSDVEMDDTTVASIDHEKALILRMRDGLRRLLVLSFDQFLDDSSFEDAEESPFSAEHVTFSNYVQLNAGRVASDLRSLFPKENKNAESALLRACALQDDHHLIGGFYRFVRSKEDQLAQADQGKAMKELLLLPLSRGVVASWMDGNRREAGLALAQITHKSEETSKSAQALGRLLKKIDSVKLLESHMACLRDLYVEWLESEPFEPESDRPTEEEMDDYALAEKEHEEMFKSLEQKAHRLAASFGVKLTNKEKKLAEQLYKFIEEGMKFAFSDSGDEEDPQMGGQLTFLSILLPYVRFVKKDQDHMKKLQAFYMTLETDLRADSMFDEIPPFEITSLSAFAKALGLTSQPTPKKKKKKLSLNMEGSDSEEDEATVKTSLRTPIRKSTTPKSSEKKRRMSTTSSVGSALSPVDETDDDDENEEASHNPSPRKVQRKAKSPIPEEQSDEESQESL